MSEAWRADARATDAKLGELGLYRKCIVKDGGSLFRAVAEAVFGSQRAHRLVRRQCADFLEDERDDDEARVAALARLYRRDIAVIDFFAGPNFARREVRGRAVHLLYHPNVRHFDLLLPCERVGVEAFCQSIAYAALYRDAFGVADVDEALTETFDERRRPMRRYVKNAPVPYKAARGLSEFVYKNIEYDSHVDSTKGRGQSLNVGGKCLCRLKTAEGETALVCYVQSLAYEGTCVVYVEKLAEKRTVRFDQLEPLPFDRVRPLQRCGDAPKNGKFVRKNKTRRSPDDPHKVQQHDKVQFKTRIIENKLYPDAEKDNNNNECDSFAEDGYYSCLTEYTKIDFYNLNPAPMEFVTMPFTVEQSSNNVSNVNNHDSGANSSSSGVIGVNNPYNALVQYTPPPVNGVTDSNGPMCSYTQSSVTNTNSIFPPPGAAPLESHSPASFLPTVPTQQVFTPVSNTRPNTIPMPYMMPRPTFAHGVNYFIQKSIQHNGSDLPYNDVQTLRYFYNLGVDWVQMTGVWLMHPPMIQPPVMANNYYYQPPSSSNQLSLDMQGLSLGDFSASNNNGNSHGSPKEDMKGNNNKPVPKPNIRYNDFRGGRGGSNNNGGRYRRNEGTFDRNYKSNGNYNRGSYQSNGRGNETNSKNTNGTEKRERSYDNHDSTAVSPSVTPNLSIPPPYHRMSSYPLDGGENANIPLNFPVPYSSYNSLDDGQMPSLDGGFLPPPPMTVPPPQYVTYLSASPQNYYPNGNMPNYNGYGQSPNENMKK